MSATIRLQREPFDVAAEAAKLTRGRTDIGAVVTFTGICRGDESGRADRGDDARALSRHGRGRDRAPRRGGRTALAAASASP